MLGRFIYEIIHDGESDDYIESSDGTKTLAGVLKDKVLKTLTFDRNNLNVKSIADLDTQGFKTKKKPVHLLEVRSPRCNIKLFLQVSTEPNLRKNCFTQSQVAEYLIRNKEKLSYSDYQT